MTLESDTREDSCPLDVIYANLMPTISADEEKEGKALSKALLFFQFKSRAMSKLTQVQFITTAFRVHCGTSTLRQSHVRAVKKGAKNILCQKLHWEWVGDLTLSSQITVK